jgi:hypothetical protein
MITNEEEAVEARKRAKEFREMAEEECPNGGFLFGDLEEKN